MRVRDTYHAKAIYIYHSQPSNTMFSPRFSCRVSSAACLVSRVLSFHAQVVDRAEQIHSRFSTYLRSIQARVWSIICTGMPCHKHYSIVEGQIIRCGVTKSKPCPPFGVLANHRFTLNEKKMQHPSLFKLSPSQHAQWQYNDIAQLTPW